MLETSDTGHALQSATGQSVPVDRSWREWRLAPLSAAEPPSLFLLKTLLCPCVAVLSLMISLILCDEPFGGPYVILAVLGFLAGDILEGSPTRRRLADTSRWRAAVNVVLHWTFIVGFLWLLLELAGLTAHLRITVVAVWVVVTPLVLWCVQAGVGFALHRSGGRVGKTRSAVIVGVTEIGLRLREQLETDPLIRTTVTGFFEDRAERLPVDAGPGAARRVLGRTGELSSFLLQHSIDFVYITLPMTRHPRMLALLDSLRDCTASVYFVPDLFVFNLVQPRFDSVNGIPVVAVRESPFVGLRGLMKRLSDIALSALIIALVSPILLAVAIGVRLSSPGPVLFKQKRYGLDGKQILVYKFRSMTVTEDGESHYTQVTRGDRRVTPFGAFIRKTSLDELPQFFNVFGGTMSIVGPRPHAIAVNEQYRRLIPGYMIRHKVKPGITGWAQINGFRGGDDLEGMRKRIECDLDYLRHWSLGLDLLIMLRTAAVMWADRRAF